jgi:biofilm PGA synthesis N-glycosyltransferase PgaC
MTTFVFWLSLFLLAYIYVGYPLVAWLRARLWPMPPAAAPWEPMVTVVVVAHNEADRIAARLDNLLALDYPREKLEIRLASDGSTDGTVERARAYESSGVVVRAFHRRRGKSAVVNDVVPSVRGDIVVFADARQRFEPGAVRALVANFADPRVGAVSGELMIDADAAGAAVEKGVGFYWRYEKFIRRAESGANSTVGATGAIYAIRRDLFQPIPEDTLLDDVLVPLRIVKSGYRVLFEPAARAYDTASAVAKQEFVRKVRTIAGTFQLFAREAWLFDPRRNPVWLETFSHKGLRLTMPALQAMALAANAALIAEPIYAGLFACQMMFYVAALGGCSGRTRRSGFVVTVPYTICLLSWATIVGFVQFATRRQKATWDRVVVAPRAVLTSSQPPQRWLPATENGPSRLSSEPLASPRWTSLRPSLTFLRRSSRV